MAEAPDTEADPEIEAAAEAARAADPAGDTRAWLLEATDATLCTLSTKGGVEGFPFGSVVPCALTAEGRPVIFIADIAAHTANLRADPRGSLFVRQPHKEGDPQTGWRVTLMGRWSLVDDDDVDEVHARYGERVPGAQLYSETHGFRYWQLEDLARVRYIAGFGKICWIDGPEILRDPHGAGVGEVAPGAIAHMNEDHAENMREMCRGLYGFQPERAEMTQLDRAGFLVRADDRLVHFSFGREITGDEVRGAIIEVLQRARARIQG